jgi:hypothetical protein
MASRTAGVRLASTHPAELALDDNVDEPECGACAADTARRGRAPLSLTEEQRDG